LEKDPEIGAAKGLTKSERKAHGRFETSENGPQGAKKKGKSERMGIIWITDPKP